VLRLSLPHLCNLLLQHFQRDFPLRRVCIRAARIDCVHTHIENIPTAGGHVIFGMQQFDAFARLCPVADDTAKLENRAYALALDVRQHGLQRWQVGMNVTKNGDGLTHGARS
jgi:hypothetical protein